MINIKFNKYAKVPNTKCNWRREVYYYIKTKTTLSVLGTRKEAEVYNNSKECEQKPLSRNYSVAIDKQIYLSNYLQSKCMYKSETFNNPHSSGKE